MAKASDNVYPRVILGLQSADQAAPADSSWRLYSKSGGVYARSSNGIVGPFGAASGASGSITASGYTQSTAKLLGRSTAATGAIEEITVGSGLTLAAGSLSASGGSFPGSGYATVATDQAATSTGTYSDLATSGPAVTIVVNTKCKVTISCDGYDSASGAAHGLMGVALSSGNTVAAADSQALHIGANTTGNSTQASRVLYFSGLTPGSTVFTSKYYASTTNFHFRYRSILVELLD